MKFRKDSWLHCNKKKNSISGGNPYVSWKNVCLTSSNKNEEETFMLIFSFYKITSEVLLIPVHFAHNFPNHLPSF